MSIRFCTLAMVTAAIVTCAASTGSAQLYRPPAGPTITPYLDFFNVPINPMLGNYHTFVRPRADLQSRLSDLGTSVRNQDRRLDRLSDDFQQTRHAQAAPTGTGSTFMYHSHYFPGTRQQGRAMPRTGR